MSTRIIGLLCLAAFLLASAPAHGQMGPGLDLTWNTIDSGGGVATGGGFTLSASIGQPDAGAMAGGGITLLGGFLGGTGAPPPCYPDCNGDGLLNLADFGCFQTKFALANSYADCNGDGVLNLADFGCFQTKFALGCP